MMNIFEASKTVLRVEEVMTDLLLCELLGTNTDFVSALCAELGLADVNAVFSVRRSVHETSLGETDVEAIIGIGSERVGLLIENKVRAVLMPDQLNRYRRRGDEGQLKGLWQRYYVAVFSPQSYRSYIPADDALAVDGYIEYEWVQNWLQSDDPAANAFKIHLLAEAIKDARIGYVKKLDTRMTSFHQSVYEIASAEFPELNMGWIEQAGYDSSIIHLPHALPARGDSLLMKMKMGTSELRIDTKDPVGAERALYAVLPKGWRSTRAKSYAGAEVPIGSLDATQDFKMIEAHVKRFLQALRQLQEFYHRPEIADIIEMNRGVRQSRSKAAKS